MSLPDVWPHIVRNGNASVKIYRTVNNGYDAFKVVYYDTDRKRRFHAFADFDAAKEKAKSLVASITKGDAQVLTLTANQRLEYLRAVDALKATGVPIDQAAGEFARAHAALNGRSIVEAARYYAKTHPHELPLKRPDEILAELLDDRRAFKRSEVHLADLKSRCGRFAAHFQMPISEITGAQVRQFLMDLNLSPRSYNNYRNAIRRLVSFAKARGYLPKDYDELSAIDRAREVRGESEIYTPDEMRRLLQASRPPFRAALALGAFAGLRSAEIERLDWSDIHLDRAFVKVSADQAKTAQRRIVPLPSNLVAWLKLDAEPSGRIWPHSHAYFYERQRETSERTADKERNIPAVEWKRNALRNSFISYRLAQTQDVARVQVEAGNSAAMIHREYKELVTPEQAAEWFGIVPQSLSC